MSENPTPESTGKDETAEEAKKQAIAEVQAHLAGAILGLQKLEGDNGSTGLMMSGGSCVTGSCG
jgi:hypothetical protein